MSRLAVEMRNLSGVLMSVIRIALVGAMIALRTIDVGAQSIAVGIGKSALASDDPYRAFEPLTASVRFGLSRFAIDVDWMSREIATELIDSGPSRMLPLNGQLGEYGRTITRSEHTRASAGVNLLLTSRADRVVGWGGAGLALVRSTTHRQGTRTGCTGPWVPHCISGNFDRIDEGTENAPQVVGGVDFRITRWVEAFAGGRASLLAGGFDAGLTGGVRLAVGPQRPDRPRAWATMADGTEQTGRLVSRSADAVTLQQRDREIVLPASNVRLLEKSDSVVNGALWGLVFGALAGWEVGSQGSGGRGMAGAMLAGFGIGMAIDELIPGRQLVK